MNGILSLAGEREVRVIVILAPYRDNVTNPTEAELMVRYRKALASEMKQRGMPFLGDH